jgi:hypothetical protein
VVGPCFAKGRNEKAKLPGPPGKTLNPAKPKWRPRSALPAGSASPICKVTFGASFDVVVLPTELLPIDISRRSLLLPFEKILARFKARCRAELLDERPAQAPILVGDKLRVRLGKSRLIAHFEAAELVIRSTGAGLFITAAGHVISGAGLSITAPIALFRFARSMYHGVRCLLSFDPHPLKRPIGLAPTLWPNAKAHAKKECRPGQLHPFVSLENLDRIFLLLRSVAANH